MSSPDKTERSDDTPNSDYAPKWARDFYRQDSRGAAEGELSRGSERSSSERDLAHLRRSLDPDIVNFRQPTPRRLGWLASSGGFFIAAALGVVIAMLPWLDRASVRT